MKRQESKVNQLQQADFWSALDGAADIPDQVRGKSQKQKSDLVNSADAADDCCDFAIAGGNDTEITKAIIQHSPKFPMDGTICEKHDWVDMYVDNAKSRSAGEPDGGSAMWDRDYVRQAFCHELILAKIRGDERRLLEKRFDELYPKPPVAQRAQQNNQQPKQKVEKEISELDKFLIDTIPYEFAPRSIVEKPTLEKYFKRHPVLKKSHEEGAYCGKDKPETAMWKEFAFKCGCYSGFYGLDLQESIKHFSCMYGDAIDPAVITMPDFHYSFTKGYSKHGYSPAPMACAYHATKWLCIVLNEIPAFGEFKDPLERTIWGMVRILGFGGRTFQIARNSAGDAMDEHGKQVDRVLKTFAEAGVLKILDAGSSYGKGPGGRGKAKCSVFQLANPKDWYSVVEMDFKNDKGYDPKMLKKEWVKYLCEHINVFDFKGEYEKYRKRKSRK